VAPFNLPPPHNLTCRSSRVISSYDWHCRFVNCGDRLLTYLVYCTIFIVMSSKVVDLHICICICTSHCLYLCTHRLRCHGLLRRRRPSFSAVMTCFHLFATVWREVTWLPLCLNWGRDSSTLLFKSPSSEFVQCALWVIRLTKAVESICCAVRHTVTLPRAVWRTIRWPHSVRILITTTTDAGHHRCPPPVLRRQQSVPSVSSLVYYAVVTTRLLLSACC